MQADEGQNSSIGNDPTNNPNVTVSINATRLNPAGIHWFCIAPASWTSQNTCRVGLWTHRLDTRT